MGASTTELLPATPAPYPLKLAGEDLAVVTTPDGKRWATATVAAAFLGYRDKSHIFHLAWTYRHDLRHETTTVLAPAVRRLKLRRTNLEQVTEQRPQRAFSPRGLVLLALVCRTARGRALRVSIVKAIEDGVVARATSGGPIDLMQDILVDAAGAIERIDLPKKGDAGALAADLVTGLEELAETAEVYRTGSIRGGALARAIAGPADPARELTKDQKARAFVRALSAGGRARQRAAGGRP